MSMRDFLRKHRKEITEATGATNDRERELWILNDESLYLWARREGARV